MPVKPSDHAARITKHAREIAKTGRHNGWFWIAAELGRSGEPLAMRVLEKEPLRSELDRTYAATRAGKRGDKAPGSFQ
jgi:hypothetical protein